MTQSLRALSLHNGVAWSCVGCNLQAFGIEKIASQLFEAIVAKISCFVLLFAKIAMRKHTRSAWVASALRERNRRENYFCNHAETLTPPSRQPVECFSWTVIRNNCHYFTSNQTWTTKLFSYNRSFRFLIFSNRLTKLNLIQLTG